MKVAIVHDWLVTHGGAERVLEQMLATYPEAQLFSLLDRLPSDQRGFLDGREVRTSFLQRIPFIERSYRRFLPLMPAAIERFDFAGYDLVLSSSSAVARGVLTTPEQLHICYLQARNLKYAYEDRSSYPAGRLRRLAEDLLLTRVRMWDSIAARRPDRTIANSRYVSTWHFHRHGVTSDVIYPPVDTEVMATFYREDKGPYFVTVGRLEPYKRMDLVVRAFNQAPAKLVVVGEGTQMRALRRLATSNIEFVGYCGRERVAEIISGARGFVFASREDFGIAPLEAQACGTPVIAYAGGGVPETIFGLEAAEPTGVLFTEQTVESLLQGLSEFERQGSRITPEACRRNALRFRPERFRRELGEYVQTELRRRQPQGPGPTTGPV
jgi:glycosyltransferase involved in cell wall biosynthesis